MICLLHPPCTKGFCLFLKGQTRPKGLALQKMFWSGTKQEMIRVDSENSWFSGRISLQTLQHKHGEQVKISCPGPYSPPAHAEVGEGQGLTMHQQRIKATTLFLEKNETQSN